MKNSSSFEAQGCYRWMTKQLNPYSIERVLDIGCGTGEGLSALLEAGARNIVSLEENFDCIVATEERLSSEGVTVEVIPRMGYIEAPDGRHDIVVDPDDPISEGAEVTLIHADPLFLKHDPQLKAYLDSAHKFSVVTVWLIGVYDMRRSCRALDGYAIADPSEYRLRVQNEAYCIADAMLVPGGVIQVVDRGIVPDTPTIEKFAIDLHREQASVTSLSVSDFAYREYTEVSGKGMRMTEINTEVFDFEDDGRRAMQSIISLKPDPKAEHGEGGKASPATS